MYFFLSFYSSFEVIIVWSIRFNLIWTFCSTRDCRFPFLPIWFKNEHSIFHTNADVFEVWKSNFYAKGLDRILNWIFGIKKCNFFYWYVCFWRSGKKQWFFFRMRYLVVGIYSYRMENHRQICKLENETFPCLEIWIFHKKWKINFIFATKIMIWIHNFFWIIH